MTYIQLAGPNLSYIQIKDDAQEEEIVAASDTIDLDSDDRLAATTSSQLIKVKNLLTYIQLSGPNFPYIQIKDDAQNQDAASDPVDLDDEDQLASSSHLIKVRSLLT